MFRRLERIRIGLRPFSSNSDALRTKRPRADIVARLKAKRGSSTAFSEFGSRSDSKLDKNRSDDGVESAQDWFWSDEKSPFVELMKNREKKSDPGTVQDQVRASLDVLWRAPGVPNNITENQEMLKIAQEKVEKKQVSDDVIIAWQQLAEYAKSPIFRAATELEEMKFDPRNPKDIPEIVKRLKEGELETDVIRMKAEDLKKFGEETMFDIAEMLADFRDSAPSHVSISQIHELEVLILNPIIGHMPNAQELMTDIITRADKLHKKSRSARLRAKKKREEMYERQDEAKRNQYIGSVKIHRLLVGEEEPAPRIFWDVYFEKGGSKEYLKSCGQFSGFETQMRLYSNLARRRWAQLEAMKEKIKKWQEEDPEKWQKFTSEFRDTLIEAREKSMKRKEERLSIIRRQNAKEEAASEKEQLRKQEEALNSETTIKSGTNDEKKNKNYIPWWELLDKRRKEKKHQAKQGRAEIFRDDESVSTMKEIIKEASANGENVIASDEDDDFYQRE